MPGVDLTEEDEGKRVLQSDGTELGIIAEVRDGTPWVDVDPTVFEKLQAKFDWGEPDKDAYPLKTAEVAEVTDDEVRLG